MLVIISLDTEETPASLVVGSHGHLLQKLSDNLVPDGKVLKDLPGPLLHDILGTRTCSHAGDLSTDALSDDRLPECPSGNSSRMHLDNFMAARVADRGIPLDHELTFHEDLGAVSILVAIKQFPGHDTAQFLNLGDLPVNGLLENFVNDLEIAGEIGPFEAPGEIYEDIEVGYEDNGSFFRTAHFNELLDVLYADPSKVDPDFRGRCLYIREIS